MILTERLELRPFAASDAVVAHERLFGDAEVMRHVGAGVPTTPAQTRALVLRYAEAHAARGWSFWAVVERATGELVGDAGLWPSALGEVELGYTIAHGSWGRGFGTEAAGACVRFGFAELGLGEIIALVDPPNHASVHVLDKLGFATAGRRRAHGREHLLFRRRRTPADPVAVRAEGSGLPHP